MRPVMFCLSQASVVLGWGRVGWEKWFRDMTLAVSISRIYKSSQRSLLKAEASSKPLRVLTALSSFALQLCLQRAHVFHQSYENRLWYENQSRPVNSVRQVPLIMPRGLWSCLVLIVLDRHCK